MRRPTPRDQSAAALYALFGFGAIAAAVGGLGVLLGIVGAVMLVAALGALRGYPIDREW